MGVERSISGSSNGNSLKQRFLLATAINATLAMFSKCCASDSNHYILYHQAAAYYYHGLILDKGNEASFHVSAVCCFLAAEQLLSESKKACLSFSLAAPVTRLGLIIIYCTHIILEFFFFFFFAQSSFFVLFFFFFGKGSPTLGINEAFTSENS
jgi:hypothetical protein